MNAGDVVGPFERKTLSTSDLLRDELVRILEAEGGLVERIVREVLARVAPRGVSSFLRVRRVCELADVSKPKVFAAIRSGALRARKLDGVVLIAVADFEGWIASAQPIAPGSRSAGAAAIPRDRARAKKKSDGSPPGVPGSVARAFGKREGQRNEATGGRRAERLLNQLEAGRGP